MERICFGLWTPHSGLKGLNNMGNTCYLNAKLHKLLLFQFQYRYLRHKSCSCWPLKKSNAQSNSWYKQRQLWSLSPKRTFLPRKVSMQIGRSMTGRYQRCKECTPRNPHWSMNLVNRHRTSQKWRFFGTCPTSNLYTTTQQPPNKNPHHSSCSLKMRSHR